MTAKLAFVLAALSSGDAANPPCDPTTDHPSDCYGLTEIAKSLNYQGWVKNTKWMEDKSVCLWHGITCDSNGRVTGVSLKANNLKGKLPDAIGNLTELEAFDIQGGRPEDYHGCVGNDLQNNSIPESLYTLKKLSDLNLEYTCTAGKLSKNIGNLKEMVSLQLHGNFIAGSIPQEVEGMSKIQTFKLGRNPFSGELPLIKTFSEVVQFNCNFCALSGRFPDTIFDYMPKLQITYWDGNGFSGPLPSSIGRAKLVSRVSFNINNFSGAIPPGICDIPAGDGPDTPDVDHDCRIGADTDLDVYQATYPWIIKVPGNNFDCPVPKCAVVGSCNKTQGTKVVNPLSPVVCH
jgi:hypothetical protein